MDDKNRIKELEAALAPFAAHARAYDGPHFTKADPSDPVASIVADDDWGIDFRGDSSITVGDLRRARSLLEADRPER